MHLLWGLIYYEVSRIFPGVHTPRTVPLDPPSGIWTCITFVYNQVKEYDYYGAYDVKKHQDYKYNELLGQDYTFDFPPHHDIVSIKLIKVIVKFQ